MSKEELQELLQSWDPELQFEEESAFLQVVVQKENLLKFCKSLKYDPKTKFDYLFCLTGMDWGKELGVIYHLESTTLKQELVVKVKTEDRENPELDSVWEIWRTAEMHEMEVFDFFGIKFKNHPNLKRLFLTPDWTGFPLRKDYVDEANMVIK
jgi:NADH-quinone oxidoreductase subunit C